jgi:hypothetical protein
LEEVKLSILIIYSGGSQEAIINTIKNCRGITYVGEIILSVVGEQSIIYPYVEGLSKKVRVVFPTPTNMYESVGVCSNEWVVVVDEHTVVGPQFIGPLLSEKLNEHKIYYPEHDHPNARYSQYLGVDIDEEFFLNNVGDHNLEQMLGGVNCVFNRDMWLKCATGSTNMLAMNYSCLKNGMVVNVVHGMICKSPAKKLLSMNHYHIPVERPVVERQRQKKVEDWSACGKR